MRTRRTEFPQLGICLFFLILLAASSRLLYSQSSPQTNQRQLGVQEPLRSAQASRVGRAPKMDGTLDDPLWQQATPITNFLQREPYEGQAPTEKTEVRILYTKHEVYFGVACHDSVIGGPVATQLRRDVTQRPFTMFAGFDSNGDTNPVTDRVGDLGRNTYYGDYLYSWDLRISRYFQIRERLRLDLMVDAFNLLNRPNVDEVTSVYGAAVICGGTATPKNYKDAATLQTRAQALAFATGTGGPTCANLAPTPSPPVPNGLFGTPRIMLNPRQFQFAAKFSF